MQAIILENFGSVEQLRKGEMPDPQAKAGEVRIRVSHAAFNPVDYKIRRGDYAGSLPLVLGADCSGVIDQIGSHVQGFSLGEEVMAFVFGQASNGTYAELVCVPSTFVVKKPKSFSLAQAAAFPLASLTAYRALISSRMLVKGDTLFIAGAGGGVGSSAVPLAKYAGASSIFTIAKNEESKGYLVEKLGLKSKHITLYEGCSHERLVEKILEGNEGHLFTFSCDFVGGDRKALCMQLTQHSGRFTTIVPEDPVFTLPSWVRGSMPIVKNLTVNFTFVGSEAFMHSKERWTIYSQQLFQLAQLVDQNHLPPPETRLVGDFCIETVKQAHQLLEEGRVKGKLVMSVP